MSQVFPFKLPLCQVSIFTQTQNATLTLISYHPNRSPQPTPTRLREHPFPVVEF